MKPPSLGSPSPSCRPPTSPSRKSPGWKSTLSIGWTRQSGFSGKAEAGQLPPSRFPGGAAGFPQVFKGTCHVGVWPVGVAVAELFFRFALQLILPEFLQVLPHRFRRMVVDKLDHGPGIKTARPKNTDDFFGFPQEQAGFGRKSCRNEKKHRGHNRRVVRLASRHAIPFPGNQTIVFPDVFVHTLADEII